MIINDEYIRKNNWPEKYVLGRLNTEELKAYEQYMKDHQQAREELQRERKLIESIRSAGSHEMKKEIRRQAELLRNPKTDWTFIYKAAAVLFVLVLVPSVIYYQNFTDVSVPSEQEQLLNKTDDAFKKKSADKTANKAPGIPDEIAETGKAEIKNENVLEADKDAKTLDQQAVKKEAPKAEMADAEILPQPSIAAGRAAISKKQSRETAAPADMLNEEEYGAMEFKDSRESRNAHMDLKQLNTMQSMTLSKAEPQKVIRLNDGEKHLKLLFHPDQSVRSDADSLRLQIGEFEYDAIVRLWLPTELYNASQSDVRAEISDTVVTLTFFKNQSFRFRMDPSVKFAKKIN